MLKWAIKWWGIKSNIHFHPFFNFLFLEESSCTSFKMMPFLLPLLPYFSPCGPFCHHYSSYLGPTVLPSSVHFSTPLLLLPPFPPLLLFHPLGLVNLAIIIYIPTKGSSHVGYFICVLATFPTLISSYSTLCM